MLFWSSSLNMHPNKGNPSNSQIMKYIIGLAIKLFKALNLKALQSKTQNIFVIHSICSIYIWVISSVIAAGRLVLEVAQHQYA